MYQDPGIPNILGLHFNLDFTHERTSLHGTQPCLSAFLEPCKTLWPHILGFYVPTKSAPCGQCWQALLPAQDVVWPLCHSWTSATLVAELRETEKQTLPSKVVFKQGSPSRVLSAVFLLSTGCVEPLMVRSSPTVPVQNVRTPLNCANLCNNHRAFSTLCSSRTLNLLHFSANSTFFIPFRLTVNVNKRSEWEPWPSLNAALSWNVLLQSRQATAL